MLQLCCNYAIAPDIHLSSPLATYYGSTWPLPHYVYNALLTAHYLPPDIHLAPPPAIFLLQYMVGHLPHVKFVLPTASRIPMAVASGSYLRGWVDVRQFPIAPSEPDDTARLAAAVEAVHQMVEREVAAVSRFCPLSSHQIPLDPTTPP